MSVYTAITKAELEAFLQRYEVGTLIQFEGIREGIINTNYFVSTFDSGKERHFVLTLFETLPQSELPYFLNLMAYLSEHQLPIAHPIADIHKTYLQIFKDKPAALIQRLKGRTCQKPTFEQCALAGTMLGQLHRIGAHFTEHRENDHGLDWRSNTTSKVKSTLSSQDSALLINEVNFHEKAHYENLPNGVIHADFFSDNLLFDNQLVSGVIDFYFACDDVLLYDIAIAINDWCSNSEGDLKIDYAKTFLNAYHLQRPLTNTEKQYWPAMLRLAALRFWLSRLHDKHFPRPGALTFIKDPDEFKNILIKRTENTQQLLSLWPL